MPDLAVVALALAITLAAAVALLASGDCPADACVTRAGVAVASHR